jgi:hypothetical protein
MSDESSDVVSKEGMPGTESEKKPTDVLLLQGPTEDGAGVRVLRARQEHVELGELRTIREGQSITGGEVVRLHAREGSRALYAEVE